MLSRKFLQIINKSFVGRFIEGKTAIFKELDPQQIYVENIRRYFSIPQKLAKFLCEMAVKQKIFKRKVGVYCPDCGRMIEAVNTDAEIPENVKCDICEQSEHDKYVFKRSEIQTIEFYQLNKSLTIERG